MQLGKKKRKHLIFLKNNNNKEINTMGKYKSILSREEKGLDLHVKRSSWLKCRNSSVTQKAEKTQEPPAFPRSC